MTTRAPVIGRQIGSATERRGIVSFVRCSSKSSWTAREWFFVLMLPGLLTSFLPIGYRRFSSYLTCDLCPWEMSGACFATPRPRDFLPLVDRRAMLCPWSATRGQYSPAEAKVASLLRSAQVAGSRADLVKVASQREDATVKEAHRNRIRTTIPNILTVKIPGSRKSSPMRHATGVWKLCSRGIGTRYSMAKIIE
ncbi:hypothetical protein [Burkholderia sp. BE17]|uniref:hypothetical protein n=1 Tax=Burkholderia sp. BE17 TaxID=2656644 RepID=UPI00128E4B2D|nr:hypothetical protein [Burkholderia sp. BE17]MPV70442.1 hypothetical protein [Burkholderia sp. BE17]